MCEEKIGSEEVIDKLPLPIRRIAWLERFHLHRPEHMQSVQLDPRFDRRYFPQNCGAFKLPCFWVLRKHLYVYGRQTKSDEELSFFEGNGLEEMVLFPVHPLSLSHYENFLSQVGAVNAKDEHLHIWAVPTSSTRTLLAWPEGEPNRALFIKTTLPFSVTGDRHLPIGDVGRGVGCTKLLEASASSLPKSFSYLPESVGFVPRTMPDSGVIIRSIPKGVKSGSFVIAPLFALSGGTSGHRPLFLTILEHGGMSAGEFLEQVICRGYARLWLELAMLSGLILEGHGQNLMLALSSDLKPLRSFVYRDLDGLRVDWDLRRLRGLPMPRDLPRACDWLTVYSHDNAYRNGMCVSHKLRMSLMTYTHLMLDKLEQVVRMWQHLGTICGPEIKRHDLTNMFSRQINEQIREMFDVTLDVRENLIHSQYEFIKMLLLLRRHVIRATPWSTRATLAQVHCQPFADTTGADGPYLATQC